MRRARKSLLLKFLRVIGWVIASVMVLLVLVIVALRIPAVQQKLTQKAISFLENKIGTEVALKSIYIGFPKNIILEGIYLEDQKRDTLLYAGKLAINTDLWALTRREINLNKVSLQHAVAFIDRAENDSAFNFTYILKAFAGDSTAVPDTLEQKGWDFSLDQVQLENLRLNYDDKLTGNLANLSLGRFDLDMEQFDLKNNTLRAGDISLRNTSLHMKQDGLPAPQQPVQKEKSDSTAAVLLSLDNLSLENINIDYEQSALGQKIVLNLGKVGVDANRLDLVNQQVDLDAVTIANTTVHYVQGASGESLPPTPASVDSASANNDAWILHVARVALTNNNIAFDDQRKPRNKGTVDFNHLHITDLNLDVDEIGYSPALIQANLRAASFQEQSGFSLRDLKGRVRITDKTATIKDLLVVTPDSRLNAEAQLEYPSRDEISSNYAATQVTASIHKSHITARDILYFRPTLTDSLPLHITPNMAMRIDAQVKGTLDKLAIDHVLFSALDSTSLRISGTVAGLSHPGTLSMNISLDRFHSTRADIERVLADTLLPDSLRLPAWLTLKGSYKGSLKKASFRTDLTSSAGAADVEGNMNLDSASALRGFDASLLVTDLDLGSIMGKPDSVMGSMSMRADLQATGLSLEEMTANLNGVIDHFDFQRYRYRNLKLDGTLRNQIVSIAAGMDDKNLDFTLAGDYDLNAEVPVYNLAFDLKTADFKALHLSSDPIRGRGSLRVNLVTRDFRVMNGNVGIRKVAIFNGDKLYAVDSLLFASIDQEGHSEIKINSDLLSADFEGSINIFGLPGVLREYFNSYYKLADSLDVKDSPPQHFRFDVKLKNTDVLTDLLVPNLTAFDPGDIQGEFDSEKQKLDLRMEIKNMQYGNVGLKSFVFSTNSDREALRYNVFIDRVMVDSMKVDGLELNGTVASDSMRTELIILDSADVNKYVLAGTLFSRDAGMEVRLEPRATLLNYQRWSLPGDNYMRFGGEKFVAHNVVFTNRREKLIIESDEQDGSPIHIGFRELNLEYLASVIAEEKPLSGLLQGDINIYPDPSGMAFTSNLSIDDLQVSQVQWGDLSLKVDQRVRNRFDMNFALVGNGNDVRAGGSYTAGESPAFDLTATITRFGLQSLQPILKSQLTDLTGSISGTIALKGTADKPDIDGSVLFTGTKFHSTFLNSSFAIDGEKIAFVDEGIALNQFDIVDSDRNKLRLNGTILTRTYRDFKFNLDLTSSHFRLLNTTDKDNKLFYGKVDVALDARIRGTMTTPIVTMEAGLSDGSNLTYVVPQSEASVLQAEGIVEFVDKTFEGDPFMKKVDSELSDTVKSTFRGIDLTARLALTDQETLTVIIDPLTGDQLTVKGNSTLTLQIDPTGDIHLTGRYEISEGTYNLSFYKFVKREFSIDKGSTITWLGDPINAQMDIRAIYNVQTSPIELFSNQLTGAATDEVNRYKQRLPFLVYLKLSGDLLQPDIGFELEMPMASRNALGGSVYARLQDINTRESDLNKQVFALLILKRFIADDPFENQEPGGFESTARRSVSKILSEQLNRLSQNIKGVELSFDIKSYEDYSSGQGQGQTELQVGVSKSLFNDRLVVKLSGNIDVEGENSKRQATDYIGDLALEYKLTPDGRLRITGFRNSDYDMIDGELTETGAGLIYVKDYNTLSELFKANARTKN